MQLGTAGFRAYVLERKALDDWNMGTGDDVPIATRAKAAAYNVFYGILGNATFWAGAWVYATIMMAVTKYGLLYNLIYYVRATFISYVWADMLPLKSFSSDGAGVMDPVRAAWRNSIRMFLPLLMSGLGGGVLAVGYSLFALAAVAAVEAGKHALFHANAGFLWADWTMLTDTLERRLALTGLSLPTNVRIIEGFLSRDAKMRVDTGKQRPW